jgi:hypothetical protein
MSLRSVRLFLLQAAGYHVQTGPKHGVQAHSARRIPILRVECGTSVAVDNPSIGLSSPWKASIAESGKIEDAEVILSVLTLAVNCATVYNYTNTLFAA